LFVDSYYTLIDIEELKVMRHDFLFSLAADTFVFQAVVMHV